MAIWCLNNFFGHYLGTEIFHIYSSSMGSIRQFHHSPNTSSQGVPSTISIEDWILCFFVGNSTHREKFNTDSDGTNALYVYFMSDIHATKIITLSDIESFVCFTIKETPSKQTKQFHFWVPDFHFLCRDLCNLIMLNSSEKCRPNLFTNNMPAQIIQFHMYATNITGLYLLIYLEPSWFHYYLWTRTIHALPRC